MRYFFNLCEYLRCPRALVAKHISEEGNQHSICIELLLGVAALWKPRLVFSFVSPSLKWGYSEAFQANNLCPSKQHIFNSIILLEMFWEWNPQRAPGCCSWSQGWCLGQHFRSHGAPGTAPQPHRDKGASFSAMSRSQEETPTPLTFQQTSVKKKDKPLCEFSTRTFTGAWSLKAETRSGHRSVVARTRYRSAQNSLQFLQVSAGPAKRSLSTPRG